MAASLYHVLRTAERELKESLAHAKEGLRDNDLHIFQQGDYGAGYADGVIAAAQKMDLSSKDEEIIERMRRIYTRYLVLCERAERKFGVSLL
tara:strand:+ start:2968 stop:3243 length:276 start_codon:yes stop_codon:yes gene_type:complete